MLLLTPTAMASARGAVQVTGKQLTSALIPATGFLPDYHTIYAGNSVSVRDTQGGILREWVHARFTQRVGGHQALLLITYLDDSRVSGAPLVTYALWTLDGTDIYEIDSQLLNVTTPQPSLPSLTPKLIARVAALR